MHTITQLKIMAHLLDNDSTALGIRELARAIGSAYYLVQRNVRQLKEKSIITLTKAGRTHIISLNREASQAIIEAERYKRQRFYKNYPQLKTILAKIIDSAGSCFFALLVFGSYTATPRKGSDLDLLIIVPDERHADEMERAVTSAARTSPAKIHQTIVTEDGFKEMLLTKGLTVAREADARHVIIYGDDQYHKLRQ